MKLENLTTDLDGLQFSLIERQGKKPLINVTIGGNARDIAFVSPACITNDPRCTGDGNYGTLGGRAGSSQAHVTPE